MSTGPGPKPPGWREPPPSATPAAPHGPAWAAPPPARTHRPRWWKLALVAALGLVVLGVVVWIALWIRPPEPARLIVLQATYDTNLAVPPNPYGKAAARDLAALSTPGGWFGNRAKLNGTPEPGRLARGALLPDIENTRERCVVVVLAAHGGRDRDGAFLFPDDATPDPSQRIRVKAVIDRLATLPPKKQKLLILDATQSPAFPDLGLVHNDFAAALLELEGDIAAVPNLVVFASTGPDQRSWVSPEWGMSSFAHFLSDGLNGAADADHDKRISGWELIDYVRPRVKDWARDHRAALQLPVVLPQGEEGERRARAMHLAMTTGSVPTPSAPVPFDPPPEVEQLWAEYRTLADETPPPQAYTPHIWREYEAWVLRFEQLTLAGDADGARAVRAKATDARRRIEAARRLDVTPQTLALPSGVGGVPYFPDPPEPFRTGIARVADPGIPASQRATEWGKAKGTVSAYDPAAARVLWVRALLKWVADDPPGRLSVVPEVLPLVSEGFALRPAELHFLVMLAAHLPPPDKSARVGPLLGEVLTLRWVAEAAAMCIPDRGYAYTEFCRPWVLDEIARGDAERRQAEDLSFATDEASWARTEVHAAAATVHYRRAMLTAERVRMLVAQWHTAAHRAPGFAEWLARDPSVSPTDSGFDREKVLQSDLGLWETIRLAGPLAALRSGEAEDLAQFDTTGKTLSDRLTDLDSRLAKQTADLLAVRPEFEGKLTPRPDAVRWLLIADAVLTAPPADGVSPADRRSLLREYRRVTRQLLVTGRTRPEALPEVSAELTKEQAFDAARRRGRFILARVGVAGFEKLTAGKPGETYQQVEFRLNEFASRAEGRKSLAEAGSRLGEVLSAIPEAADKPGPDAEADRMLRLVTAPAAPGIRKNPADQLRRQGVREVLTYQARRTLLDHWYGENGAKYYLACIGQLRTDAGKVFAIPEKAPDPFIELVRAEEEFPVEPVIPTRFVMTDEPAAELSLDFTRKSGRSGRPGFPVFWAEQPFPSPEPPTIPERTPYGTEPGSTPTPFARTVRGPAGPKPVTPTAIPGTLRVTGFYRGRTITRGVNVSADPTPDHTAVQFPNPDLSAALAVRANPALIPKLGYGNGTVVLILDCSGSMRPEQDPKGPPPYPDATLAVNVPSSRYAIAVKALEDILYGLPPGTVITVWTFGRRSSGADVPERTIQTLLPPTRIEYDRKVTIEKVMSEARGVTIGDLWHKSPIVHSMVEAKDWLRRNSQLPGPFKSIVLISDETDNRVTEDPRFANPKREIKDILKAEFQDSGVYLGVVALRVDDEADKKMQAEFKTVEGLNPAGMMVPPEKAADLAKWLRTGLLPRIRYTLGPTVTPGRPTELTAAPSDPDNWFSHPRLPGRYKVQVNGDLQFSQDIFLRPGDRLWLELGQDGDQLQLKRRSFTLSWPEAIAQVGGGKWRMAAFQNWEKGGQVRIVAGIDEDQTKVVDTITQTEIADVWFDLTPNVAAKPRPMAVRWRPEPGFPGPCWSVTTAGGWPAGGKGAASPLLEARWSGERPFRAINTWTPPGGYAPVGIRSELFAVGDTTVSLDSVTFERHVVEVAPDKFEQRWCLVARLTHPADNPVWVRPVGFVPVGSEVRFYKDANRVTCLFWWDESKLDTTAVNAAVTGFEVVSRREVFAEADADGRHLKLDNLPAPSDKSLPPTPPVQATMGRN